MSNSVYDVDFIRTFPEALKHDPSILAIAKAVADELRLLANEVRKAVIYAAIDELPEDALDALAYDFKVDWWNYDYTLAEKRATLKDSWSVHRKIGTPHAVLKALGAIYADTSIKEWYEYGGDPHYFRLLIPVDQQALDPSKHARVLSLIAYYKNLRSVLDEVEYFGSSGAAIAYTAAAFVGCETVVTATAHNY